MTTHLLDIWAMHLDVQGNFAHNCTWTWDYAFIPAVKYLYSCIYVCIKVYMYIHILAHMLSFPNMWHNAAVQMVALEFGDHKKQFVLGAYQVACIF